MRPIASVRVLTLVGRRFAWIIDGGATEFPPDSEFTVPMVATNSPFAPARAMPYVGLCGLFDVSFSERAGITTPFVFARVAAAVLLSMPRRSALFGCIARPKDRSTPTVCGMIAAGRPSFA